MQIVSPLPHWHPPTAMDDLSAENRSVEDQILVFLSFPVRFLLCPSDCFLTFCPTNKFPSFKSGNTLSATPHFDYSRQCIPDKNHNGAFKYKIDRWSFIVSCSPTFFIITANKDIIHRNVGTCCRSPPAFCRNPVQKPIRQQTTALAHLINSSIMLHW